MKAALNKAAVKTIAKKFLVCTYTTKQMKHITNAIAHSAPKGNTKAHQLAWVQFPA